MVPKEYRQLLDYISPAAFKVIDWKKAVVQFAKISKNMINQKDAVALAENIAKSLPDTVYCDPMAPKIKVPAFKNLNLAETILDIYFGQLFSEEGFFMDLRLHHFNRADGGVLWRPSGLRYKFSKEFRTGMLAIYEGYYMNKKIRLEQGMQMTGLITDKNNEDYIKSTIDILLKHFGDANNSEVNFQLSEFRASFHQLFTHLKEYQVSLPADFLFLGIYLVTLYSALEQIGHPIDVKKCFLSAWSRNNQLTPKTKQNTELPLNL